MNQKNIESGTFKYNDKSIFAESSIKQSDSTEEDDDMFNIKIIIGDKTFFATLYDNEATRSLISQFPITLNMNELNGNEKYYYMTESLPTDSNRPDEIHMGDLMLYGNNCLVLFYKNFSTSYSYTSLGSIDNTDGLLESLGSGDVKVTFQLN